MLLQGVCINEREEERAYNSKERKRKRSELMMAKPFECFSDGCS